MSATSAVEAARRIVGFDPVHGDQWGDAECEAAVTVARAYLAAVDALEKALAYLEPLEGEKPVPFTYTGSTAPNEEKHLANAIRAALSPERES